MSEDVFRKIKHGWTMDIGRLSKGFHEWPPINRFYNWGRVKSFKEELYYAIWKCPCTEWPRSIHGWDFALGPPYLSKAWYKSTGYERRGRLGVLGQSPKVVASWKTRWGRRLEGPTLAGCVWRVPLHVLHTCTCTSVNLVFQSPINPIGNRALVFVEIWGRP